MPAPRYHSQIGKHILSNDYVYRLAGRVQGRIPGVACHAQIEYSKPHEPTPDVQGWYLQFETQASSASSVLGRASCSRNDHAIYVSMGEDQGKD
jgi:hypothetical protein